MVYVIYVSFSIKLAFVATSYCQPKIPCVLPWFLSFPAYRQASCDALLHVERCEPQQGGSGKCMRERGKYRCRRSRQKVALAKKAK